MSFKRRRIIQPNFSLSPISISMDLSTSTSSSSVNTSFDLQNTSCCAEMEDTNEEDTLSSCRICQHDPHGQDFMLSCDSCGEWFHGACVKVTQLEAEAMVSNNLKFACPSCKGMDKKQENHCPICLHSSPSINAMWQHINCVQCRPLIMRQTL